MLLSLKKCLPCPQTPVYQSPNQTHSRAMEPKFHIFKGGAGACRDGMPKRHSPQPRGCCPPRGAIFRELGFAFTPKVPLLDVELRLNISLDFLNQAAILYVFLPRGKEEPTCLNC